jgi:hypothetical protein
LEDPGVDGKIILKWIFKMWDGDMDWIDLVLRFHKMRKNFLTSLELVSSSRRTLLHAVS